MFLKQSKYKNDRVYLSIVENYRDKQQKVKQKTILKLGYLDELQKIYDNPIDYFKKEAKRMTDEKANNSNYAITFTNFDIIENEIGYQSNLGYSFFQKIYHDLGVSDFLNHINKDINAMLKLLVYSKLIYQQLPQQVFDSNNNFFESFEVFQDEILNSFKYSKIYKEKLQEHLFNKSLRILNRDTSISYYHCINYYLDFNENVEQEFKEYPIIQLGLLLDNNGIPLTYDLLPINKYKRKMHDLVLSDAKEKFNLEKIVIVVSKDLNFNDNSFYNLAKDNGYIYGKNIKSASKEFKEYILNQRGFVIDKKENVKIKSRIVTLVDTNKEIKQKQVITYNEEYAKRQKRKREREIIKSERVISYPDLYDRNSIKDVAKYIKNLKFEGDKIINNSKLALDVKKIRKDEMYDGYYAIITSEIEKSDIEIRNTYRGLLKIDDTFKLAKMESSERVLQNDLLETHFLVCFLELLLLRILGEKINNAYSTTRILKSLRNFDCIYLKENLYLFNYRDEVIEQLEQAFDVDFSKRVLNKAQIKEMIK